MSLPHAILGLLNTQPMTGYELKTVWFDRTITHFWASDHTQIYRTLDKLAEQNLVESIIEYQEDRPNRKIYSITEAGKNELKKWLATPQASGTVRDPFMIQLFFGAQLDNQKLLELIEIEKRTHQERLARYEQILAQVKLNSTRRDQILRQLTIERGVKRENSHLEWLEHISNIVLALPEE